MDKKHIKISAKKFTSKRLLNYYKRKDRDNLFLEAPLLSEITEAEQYAIKNAEYSAVIEYLQKEGWTEFAIGYMVGQLRLKSVMIEEINQRNIQSVLNNITKGGAS